MFQFFRLGFDLRFKIEKILLDVSDFLREIAVGLFYVIFFISESSNPEWYDRVNSYIRMNNYQEFINSKAVDYMWEFHKEGLDQISDVP